MKKFLAAAAAALVFAAAAAAAPKIFTMGDTTFNPENEEPNVDPHTTYAGWACIRYGVGETLFRWSDEMRIQPWLAESYKNIDPLTWEITLRPGVRFSSGRALDAKAAKECLEHLISVHDRARGDLAVESVSADGLKLTIRTASPRPTLLNYLSDPYGCIIDMNAGTDEGIVVGTGPYKAVRLVSGQRLELVKNDLYWNGEPGYDKVVIRTISDGDTLTMALQAGEIDAAYGMPYASYPLFRNEKYTISGVATSRAFFLDMNFKSPIAGDPAVRRAIALGIDKKGFVETLLQGSGYPAAGVFPGTFVFGGDAVSAPAYDPEAARKVLSGAGWIDTDGDGIRERGGVKLRVRWLTYPSRQELPLLAEAAQASLKAVGIDVVINSTAGHNAVRRRPDEWDVYASAMVTAPTGDPEYFFTTHCLADSSNNNGGYRSDALEALAAAMKREFDPAARADLAVRMQRTILDDDAFVFCSHLKMSIISKASVAGLSAHPCDFYEITADLRPVE